MNTKATLVVLLSISSIAMAQSGSIGGGTPKEEKVVLPALESNTWRGSGSGMAVVSRLDACTEARKDGNSKISLESFRLQRDAHRVIKGSSMSDCSCEGPGAGGWFKCAVDIGITHTNR